MLKVLVVCSRNTHLFAPAVLTMQVVEGTPVIEGADDIILHSAVFYRETFVAVSFSRATGQGVCRNCNLQLEGHGMTVAGTDNKALAWSAHAAKVCMPLGCVHRRSGCAWCRGSNA